MTVPLPPAPPPGEPIEARLRRGHGARSIVLVGLMGAGKSTVGRRLAGRLGLMFKDADPEIEAVYIATPNHLHRAAVEALARSGKAILCEKPMAASLADAEAMAAAVDRGGTFYGTAFDQRHHPAHLQATA